MNLEGAMEPKTPDPCPDLETLAAFLDGRLSDEAGTRIVEHLAVCEACYEIATETMHFQQENPEVGKVVSFPGEWTLRRTVRIGLPVAAALMVTLVGGLLLRGRFAEPELSASGLTASLGRGEALRSSLGEGWDQPGFPAYRGTGTGAGAGEVLRLGVRAVDLQVALRADDGDRAESLVQDLMRRLSGIEGSEALRFAYQALLDRLEAGEPPAALADTAALNDGLLSNHLESRAYSLGKWAEAARLAALTGEKSHFEAASTRAFLRQIRQSPPDPTLAPPLEVVAVELQGDAGEMDLPALARALGEIVRWRGPGDSEP